MNTSEIQIILSRLYTDAYYLERFLATKEQFYEEEHIADLATRAFLDALKPEQLRFFAKSLHAKHLHETLRLIPLSRYLLGSNIHARFREFSRKPATYGIHRQHEEALGFLNMLRDVSGKDRLMQDVLRFEAELIRHFLRPAAWKLCLFRYNVLHMLAAWRSGAKPLPRKCLTLLIFRKNKPLLKFGFRD